MSQLFPGFVGPSYQLANQYAAIERTVGWTLTANESQREEKKYDLAFEPVPGNQQFCNLPVPPPFNQPNRGLIENRGVAYGVNGTAVFSISAAGVFTLIGTCANDGTPCSLVANGNGQIFVASAGQGYVIPANALANSLIPLVGNAGFLGASFATFQDGYGIVVTPASNQFQISGSDSVPLGDFTQWDGANVSVQAGQADYLQAVISSREYLRLLGARRSQIYYDAGSQGIGMFPFQSYNETFIETGIAAPFSLADLGNALIWVGQDQRGMTACWLDPAFQPQRVSTFAVEQIWQSYVNVADAVAFAYTWNGHLKYRITFPSAFESAVRFPLGAPAGAFTAATWEYDVTVSQLLGRHIWTEVQYHTGLGNLVGRPELFHCYAYGKHLVGSGGADGNPGAIYQMGYQGTTQENPQILLRWSNDGGKTYTPEQNMTLGLAGAYTQRVYWNRNGYARDRVYWVRTALETECGTNYAGAQVQVPIVRDRICPHLWNNYKRRIYNRIEFELARGIGSVDGVTPSNQVFGMCNAMLDITELAS
jgi:hypothetical protein